MAHVDDEFSPSEIKQDNRERGIIETQSSREMPTNTMNMHSFHRHDLSSTSDTSGSQNSTLDHMKANVASPQLYNQQYMSQINSSNGVNMNATDPQLYNQQNMSQEYFFNNISPNATNSELYNQPNMFKNEFLQSTAFNKTSFDQSNNQSDGQMSGSIRPCDIICDESQPKKFKSCSQDPEAIKCLLKQFDKMFPINKLKFKEIEYDQCKNCNKKCFDIENNDLYYNLKDDVVLCKDCLQQGKFSDETSFTDYRPINEIKNKLKISDLDILSAVYKNGDNWTAIAKELDTFEEECVIRFLKIDLTEKMTLDAPVFQYSANRIIALVSFLCTCVDPKVASEFSKEILINFEKGHSEEVLISLGLHVAKISTSKVLLSEEQKFERVCEVLLQAQARKLELKEQTLKELNNFFTSQKSELLKYRDVYRSELEEMRKEKN